MRHLLITLSIIWVNAIQGQAWVGEFQTSICIEWKKDSNSTYQYLRDSVKYGFIGFYESHDFCGDSVIKYISNSICCPEDSAGILSTAMIMGYKPLIFCDSFQSGHSPHLSIGYYRNFDGSGLISSGSQIKYSSNSVFRSSEDDFLLFYIMRINPLDNYKIIAIRDKGGRGPQEYHIKFELDSFDINLLPEVLYFDFVDVSSKFYPSRILEESERDPIHKFFNKTLYSFSRHKSSLMEIDELLNDTNYY